MNKWNHTYFLRQNNKSVSKLIKLKSNNILIAKKIINMNIYLA